MGNFSSIVTKENNFDLLHAYHILINADVLLEAINRYLRRISQINLILNGILLQKLCSGNFYIFISNFCLSNVK